MLAPSPPQAGFLYTIQPRLQPRVMLHEHVSSEPFKCGNRGSKAVPKTNRTIALAELASVARLSQFHLARYFRRAFGAAPIAYHRALRLERAADFLSRGEGSVARAAELIGYSDAVALSHAFRKHFGAPPQRYAMGRRAT